MNQELRHDRQERPSQPVLPQAGADMPLLRLDNVTKTYGPVRACSDISLQLNAGEVLILVGENGAGKSTLMKILAGVIARDAGDVFIHGSPVTLGHPRAAMEAGVGIVHQELALAEDMTVYENLFMGRERTKRGLLDRNRMRVETRDLFDGLQISISPDAQVSGLSLGQRQMVEIAKAISMNSKILILDEPTASLEAEARTALFKTLRHLQTKGVGIIFCSHHLEECLEIGDRVVVLRDGEKVADRDTDALSVQDVIADMLGQEIGHQYPQKSRSAGDLLLETQSIGRSGVFSDVSISVRQGEIVGLAGLDGSGKVDVARALYGTARHSSGEILWKGQPVARGWNPRKAMGEGIAFLPGERKTQGLFLDETVAYNMSFASLRELCGRFLNLTKERRAVADMIQRLRIKTAGQDIAIKGLSGGNQQKVLLGRWMLRKPQMLIFEEPTRGIDVHAKTEVYGLIGDLVRTGSSVIIVSSDLPEIQGLCDRVYVMRRGQMVVELRDDAITQETIAHYSTAETASAA